MANQPIGVTFIPTEDAAAQGQKRGSLEGSGGSDLAEAFKVISLHLPRFLGSRALASPGLLNGPGAAGVSGGFNPHAAVFDALLKAMNGGGDLAQSLSSLYGSPSGSSSGGGYGGAPSRGMPSVIPGDEGHRSDPYTAPGPDLSQPAPTNTRIYSSDFGEPVLGRRRN